jgi:hypothetical protein
MNIVAFIEELAGVVFMVALLMPAGCEAAYSPCFVICSSTEDWIIVIW